MTWRGTPPPQWETFLLAVREWAPAVPAAVSTDHATAREAYGLLDTFIGALGREVPGVVGHLMNALTADNAVDFFRSAVEGAIFGAGGTAGMVVSPGLAVLEGAYDALQRSDEVESFLIEYTAFVTSLARLSTQAIYHQDRRNLVPLSPEIPESAERGGHMYGARNRGSYRRGVRRAYSVRDKVDLNIAPDDQDKFSKQCFEFVARQTAYSGRYQEDTWRVRDACERIYYRRILDTDLAQQRERLRRWGMEG